MQKQCIRILDILQMSLSRHIFPPLKQNLILEVLNCLIVCVKILFLRADTITLSPLLILNYLLI